MADDLALPSLDRAIAHPIASADECGRWTARPLNAIVLDAQAPLPLLVEILERAAERADPVAQAEHRAVSLTHVGALPSWHHFDLAIRAGCSGGGSNEDRARHWPLACRYASRRAQRHARSDRRSMLAWARGSLGAWISDIYPGMDAAPRDTLALCALGLDQSEIAMAVGLRPKTLRDHAAHVEDVTRHAMLELSFALARTLADADRPRRWRRMREV